MNIFMFGEKTVRKGFVACWWSTCLALVQTIVKWANLSVKFEFWCTVNACLCRSTLVLSWEYTCAEAASACCDVICLEVKNANMLKRGVACSQLIRLVQRSPWPVLTLIDRQPMAAVVSHMKRTEAIHAHRNWLYTLAHCGALRLLCSMCGLSWFECEFPALEPA